MCWANNTKPGQLRTSPLQPLDLLASDFCFVAFILLNTLYYIVYISINIKFCSQHCFLFHLKEIIICGQIFKFNSDRTWCFWAASTIIFLFCTSGFPTPAADWLDSMTKYLLTNYFSSKLIIIQYGFCHQEAVKVVSSWDISLSVHWPPFQTIFN